jgi:threonine dehydrogenase-like Zn-dependent dehydrogenase
MIRRGGTVEAFGICAANDNMALSPFAFVLGERKVSGSCAGIGNDWGDAITLLRYGRVKPLPLLSMVTPLEDLENAMKEIQINKKHVKVIVSPEISQRIYF